MGTDNTQFHAPVYLSDNTAKIRQASKVKVEIWLKIENSKVKITKMADGGPSKSDIEAIFQRLRSIPANKVGLIW